MLADRRERAARVRGVALRGVMEVERGTVVDQPQAVVPDQQVRVLGGAVDVRHECVEPDDVGGELGGGRGADGRAVRQGRRKKVDAEVQALARHEQILDLGIRLGATECRVELDEREPRDEQPERARELAGDDLGEERLAALSRAAKLEDVEAVVVGLDERGQRPALPKRGDVAGGGDALELHGHSLTHDAPTLGSDCFRG